MKFSEFKPTDSKKEQALAGDLIAQVGKVIKETIERVEQLSQDDDHTCYLKAQSILRQTTHKLDWWEEVTKHCPLAEGYSKAIGVTLQETINKLPTNPDIVTYMSTKLKDGTGEELIKPIYPVIKIFYEELLISTIKALEEDNVMDAYWGYLDFLFYKSVACFAHSLKEEFDLPLDTQEVWAFALEGMEKYTNQFGYQIGALASFFHNIKDHFKENNISFVLKENQCQ